MTELPSGTVTFLFTDVEGSTELLYRLGDDRGAGALAEHAGLLRDAFAHCGGREVDTQGDAFFVAFAARQRRDLRPLPRRSGRWQPDAWPGDAPGAGAYGLADRRSERRW